MIYKNRIQPYLLFSFIHSRITEVNHVRGVASWSSQTKTKHKLGRGWSCCCTGSCISPSALQCMCFLYLNLDLLKTKIELLFMYLVLDFRFYIRTISTHTVSRVNKPRSHTTMLNQFKYSLDASRF